MADRDQIIIRVENLTAGYGDRIILNDLSFEIRRGEIFGILGDSGSGKSTLLKHMIGLMQPRTGRILIDGEDIVSADEHQLRRITQKIGVSYQSGALFGSMSLIENVCLPLEELTDLPSEAMELIAMMKLQLVGLGDSVDLMPAEISGGMRKRAAIARAMALDPEIIFFDEPSAGLDPVTGAEIDDLILQLAGNVGITFVIVTHELASIMAITQNVIMLEKASGRIIARGNPHDLRERSEDPRVRRFFHRLPADEPLPQLAAAESHASSPTVSES